MCPDKRLRYKRNTIVAQNTNKCIVSISKSHIDMKDNDKYMYSYVAHNHIISQIISHLMYQ